MSKINKEGLYKKYEHCFGEKTKDYIKILSEDEESIIYRFKWYRPKLIFSFLQEFFIFLLKVLFFPIIFVIHAVPQLAILFKELVLELWEAFLDCGLLFKKHKYESRVHTPKITELHFDKAEDCF